MWRCAVRRRRAGLRALALAATQALGVALRAELAQALRLIVEVGVPGRRPALKLPPGLLVMGRHASRPVSAVELAVPSPSPERWTGGVKDGAKTH